MISCCHLSSYPAAASVAVMRKDRIVLANVGDSQAFMMRNGRELNLCTPHRVYGRGARPATLQSALKSTLQSTLKSAHRHDTSAAMLSSASPLPHGMCARGRGCDWRYRHG